MNCNYCEFRCNLSLSPGVCGRYTLSGGAVVEKEPFFWLHPHHSDMESMPFFHAMPGEDVLQIGTVGCNAGCDYCINSHVAIEREPVQSLQFISPEQIIRHAERFFSKAVIFAINEITVFLPSALAVAKAAHASGIKTGCLTNGFLTEKAATELAKNMDYICLSIKSMRDDFYKKRLCLPSVEPVLRNARIFNSSAHMEIVTPIDEEISYGELREIADFILSVNSDTPWHLFQMFKAHKSADDAGRNFEDTIAFLNEMHQRLPYIYFENFPGSRWVDTLCPSCGHLVIRRISIGACGARYMSEDLSNNDHCPKCGKRIPIKR